MHIRRNMPVGTRSTVNKPNGLRVEIALSWSSMSQALSNRVYIFGTTLRDGEQSPGCSMTVPEKLRMAHKLVDLGVDIL